MNEEIKAFITLTKKKGKKHVKRDERYTTRVSTFFSSSPSPTNIDYSIKLIHTKRRLQVSIKFRV